MFLLIQMVVMAGGVKLYDMIKGAGSTNLLTNGNLMVGLTLLNSVVVGAVFMALRWSPFSRSYMQKRPWAVLIWTALLALGSIPLADALSSLTNVKMPAEELQLLTTLVTHPWGWIAVGVLVRLMPGSADMQLVDLFAGDTPRLILFMLCALCVFVPSLWQLRQRL